MLPVHAPKTQSLDAEAITAAPTISRRLAEYVSGFTVESIPKEVLERSKYLILDAVGIALASTYYDFSHRTLSGLTAVAGPGPSSLIGLSQRLPLRDAVLMNGLLIHGLDYDDTHVNAIVHPTSSAFACALGMAEHLGIDGRQLLAAYILGVEVSTRLGLAAKGDFHHFGFHPTGIAAHFACALQAGWLQGLNAQQLTMAQGIVGSTASGSQEFLEEGAWNKRLHPGWAGVAGITAAALARNGFIGPTKVYEGRFGLYKSHLHDFESKTDYSQITANLGSKWEVVETSIKPFPICHLIHACADSALEIRRKHNLDYREIERVRALLPQETLQIVAEPPENKVKPANSYDGKFSAQYVVATCFVQGRFGLADLETDALGNPEVLALAQKVVCEADPRTRFPEYFSGGVAVTTRDGREFRHYEPINRGSGERALTKQDIEAKFMENAVLAVSPGRARGIRDTVLRLDSISAAELAAGLRA
jgi:2-methylcitrate dehydratase PrpD